MCQERFSSCIRAREQEAVCQSGDSRGLQESALCSGLSSGSADCEWVVYWPWISFSSSVKGGRSILHGSCMIFMIAFQRRSGISVFEVGMLQHLVVGLFLCQDHITQIQIPDYMAEADLQFLWSHHIFFNRLKCFFVSFKFTGKLSRTYREFPYAPSTPTLVSQKLNCLPKWPYYFAILAEMNGSSCFSTSLPPFHAVIFGWEGWILVIWEGMKWFLYCRRN